MSDISEETLSGFKTALQQGYEESRMDRILCASATHGELPKRSLMMYSRPIRFQIVNGRGKDASPLFTSRSVDPVDVGFTISLEDWKANPTKYAGMNDFMKELGVEVANNELSAIVKNLKKFAGHTIESKTPGKFTLEDLYEARRVTRQDEVNLDILLADPMVLYDFVARKELLDAGRIPTSYIPVDIRGPHFIGIMKAWKVYSVASLHNEIITYERRYAASYATPLKVEFKGSPFHLTVEKKITTSPKLSESVVVLNMKKGEI